MTTNAIIVPVTTVSTPWYVEKAHVNIFTGEKYGRRCIAAIGPRDGTKVALHTTANPRQRVSKLERETGLDLVVHDARWSTARDPEKVLKAALHILQTRGLKLDEQGFFPMQAVFIRPLLTLACRQAGIASMDHPSFANFIRRLETEKLRREAYLDGVPPETVAILYRS